MRQDGRRCQSKLSSMAKETLSQSNEYSLNVSFDYCPSNKFATWKPALCTDEEYQDKQEYHSSRLGCGRYSKCRRKSGSCFADQIRSCEAKYQLRGVGRTNGCQFARHDNGITQEGVEVGDSCRRKINRDKGSIVAGRGGYESQRRSITEHSEQILCG